MTSEPRSASSSIVRPRLRGVADIYAALAAIPAVIVLVIVARPGAATAAAAVYGASLVVLLVGSAIYHLPGWPVRTAMWLRRIDQANIHLLIAGSATPMALAATPGPGEWLLVAMWIAAALGVIKTLVSPKLPRELDAAIYILMGALTLTIVPALQAAVPPGDFALLIAGGLLYLIGGIVYALRWPNPEPLVFGYHEIFHGFVFSAALAHYLAIWTIVT